jgi:hypothetical protein
MYVRLVTVNFESLEGSSFALFISVFITTIYCQLERETILDDKVITICESSMIRKETVAKGKNQTST